jgi:1-deoxy-D-xylulose-5-phosphate synthase
MNPKIVGITPAMPTGSSLKYMMEEMPDRAFDVGISEQHAVTLAAGLATEGMVPFCNIYSTFLQRAYDQVIHDVALQDLPVIFCLDRAGLVGEDGATHHGVYDIAYLRCIPNLIIFAPMNESELRDIMYTAQLGLDHPIAIRYPRGKGVLENWMTPFGKIPIGVARELRKGSHIAVLSLGHIGNTVAKAISELRDHARIGHFDMRFAKPMDTAMLAKVFGSYQHVITIEDGSKIGGYGSAVLAYANDIGATQKIDILGIDDRFIEHGSVAELHRTAKIDAETIKEHLNLILDAY